LFSGFRASRNRTSMQPEHLLDTFAEDESPHYGAEKILALNAFIAAFAWLYFVSSGFTAPALLDGVYEIQAAMLGKARLTIEPGPLSAFFHDALLYWGEYYFYWGLVPSVVFLALETAIGRVPAHYLTVFLFLFSLVYFFQRIVKELLTAASADKPPARGAVALMCLSLTWVVLFVIPYPLEHGWFFGRFAVYEQQILFGLALGFPGLYFLIKGLRKRRLATVANGTLFFCLAACTRVTWFPWAIVALLGTAFLRWSWGRDEDTGSRRNFSSLALLTGLLLILGLMFLNEYRFGSWTDFGVRYQDPGHYLYFRNLKLFFSPVTKAWNCAFNLMSYYAPPSMVEHLGLEARSFAFREGFPPSFFAFNPQFLLLVVLFPLGLYRMAKSRSSLAVPFFVVAACAVYLHLIVGVFGTFVILRYFVEFYYLTALLFLGTLLMLLRPVWATLIFVAMIGLYIPGNVKHFMSFTPELRTLNWSTGREWTAISGNTPFVERPAVWPRGSFSAKDVAQATSYAALGVKQAGPSMVIGMDVCAVYLVIEAANEGTAPATLTVQGLRSLTGRGTVRFYFEDRLIGSVPLEPDAAVNFSAELPFAFSRPGPYQIMIVFLEEGASYLPGRTSMKPVVAFREISLRKKPHQSRRDDHRSGGAPS
jgi:hypothetical protein